VNEKVTVAPDQGATAGISTLVATDENSLLLRSREVPA
jgi:hypothetical protein